MNKFLLGFLIISTMSCDQDSKTRSLTTKEIPFVYQKGYKPFKVVDHSARLSYNPYKVIKADVPSSEYALDYYPDCEKPDAVLGFLNNPQKIVKDMQYDVYEIDQAYNTDIREKYVSTLVSRVTSDAIVSESTFNHLMNYFSLPSNIDNVFTAKPHFISEQKYKFIESSASGTAEEVDQFILEENLKYVNYKPQFVNNFTVDDVSKGPECIVKLKYKEIADILNSKKVDLINYPIDNTKSVRAYIEKKETRSTEALCYTKSSGYKSATSMGLADETIVEVQSPLAIDFGRPSLCYNGLLYYSRTIKLKSGEIVLSEVRKVLSTPLK